jgi:hypothetical protein
MRSLILIGGGRGRRIESISRALDVRRYRLAICLAPESKPANTHPLGNLPEALGGASTGCPGLDLPRHLFSLPASSGVAV